MPARGWARGADAMWPVARARAPSGVELGGTFTGCRTRFLTAELHASSTKSSAPAYNALSHRRKRHIRKKCPNGGLRKLALGPPLRGRPQYPGPTSPRPGGAAVLYNCIDIYYTMLYYTILHCTIIYHTTILCYTVSTILYYAILHYSIYFTIQYCLIFNLLH